MDRTVDASSRPHRPLVSAPIPRKRSVPTEGIAVGQNPSLLDALRDRAPVAVVAMYLVTAAAAWYLLKELSSVLRPLLFAMSLAYIIIPVQAGLARKTSRVVGTILLGLG